MEFEWKIFTGYNTLQLLLTLDETPENFTGRIIFMSMFNDISCGSKDNEKDCLANAKLASLYAKRFGKGQWSLIGPGSEKSGTVSVKTVHKEYGTIWLTGCCWNSQRVVVQSFALRALCPDVDSKSKGHGKLSIHYAADLETIETIFRIIVSANQLSLYGAVAAEMCEEYETLHERTVRPFVMAQSSSSPVPSVIKTEVLLDCDDPANKDLLLQQYGERIEKLSQQDKLSTFCMDTGFLNVVEIGQYFMTKDTAEFSQFHAVACREYTLPREGASQPKGRIQGNSKIETVLEVVTSYLHGKYGVEIRIWSVNRDNTHSWVRVSHGSNKFVIRNFRSSARRMCVKIGCERYCMSIKGSSKTTKKRTCQLFAKNSSYWEENLD